MHILSGIGTVLGAGSLQNYRTRVRHPSSCLDRSKRLRAQRWVLFVLLFLLGREAESQPDFQPAMKPVVAHTVWTGRDGAPGNIAAIAQSTDGYLWLGTAQGLYRFDGVQFSSYPISKLEAKLPSADIEALNSDPDGGLWIGFRMGGISHLTHDGRVIDYNLRNGLGPNSAQKFVIRPDGSVWAIGDNRLLVLRDDRWEDFGSKHGLPRDQLFALYFDRQGNLWTSARHRLYVLHAGESSFSLYPAENFMVVDVAQTPDDQIWLSDAWHSVRPLISNGQSAIIQKFGYVRMLITPSGELWMAQDYRGVSHISLTDKPLDVGKVVREQGLSSEQTNAILRGRDGVMWVGTSRGLDRFPSFPFQDAKRHARRVLSSPRIGPFGGSMDRSLVTSYVACDRRQPDSCRPVRGFQSNRL